MESGKVDSNIVRFVASVQPVEYVNTQRV